MDTVSESVVRSAAPRWWRRPWIAPFAIVACVFVVFSLPPYLTGDPAQSRVAPPAAVALFYPFLVGHVVFGAVALLTSCFQVWPWFRDQHRAAHRVIGHVYVFGGVVPAALMALPVAAMSPFGPVARASNVLLGLLWLAFTLMGYRMMLRGDYAAHRRWMIRSFALTASIITNRIWGAGAYFALAPQLDTTFGGNEQLFAWIIAGLATWLGWVLPLLVSQWWLERSH